MSKLNPTEKSIDARIVWECRHTRIAIMHRTGGVTRDTVTDVAHILAPTEALARAAFEQHYAKKPDAISRLLVVDVVVTIR